MIGRSKGDPLFLAALDELRAMHLSKGHDYADEADPLRNYTQSAKDNGVPSWRGAQLRLSEKYHRLINLTQGGGILPRHESLDDTLMDIAALALIVRALRARDSRILNGNRMPSRDRIAACGCAQGDGCGQ